MIRVAREAGAREGWEQEEDGAWGPQAGADTPQLVLALRRQGSREQAWNLRLLGRAVARRLPQLRVTLACVDRDLPALPDVMAAATSTSVVVPLWLCGTDRVQRQLFTASALSRHSVQVAAPLGPDPLVADVLAWRLRAAGARSGEPVVLAVPGPADPDGHLDVVRAAAMLRARWGGAAIAVAYTAGSPRTVDAAVRALRQTGARRVAVAPYMLMPGMDAGSVALQAEQAGVSLVAEPPGMHPLVVELVVRRYLAAMESARSRIVAA
jgi:sirohydrochlorin ferrochelatase